MNTRDDVIVSLADLLQNIDDTKDYLPHFIKILIAGVMFIFLGIFFTILSPLFAFARNKE